MFKELKQIIKDHIDYRQQILKLAKSDLIKTYRGSALGWSWAIIKPIVTIFVYWFAFTIGLRAGKSVNGYPFFLWLIAGIVPWFYMSEMITGGTDAIRKYKFLVNNKVVVSSRGVECLCKNVFKQKYLELLESYKMDLTEKFIKAGYIYDNFFNKN